MIAAFGVAQFNAQYRGSPRVSIKQIVGIPICHDDGVWIKVETRPVMRLGIRRIIRQVDGIVIIDDCLDAIAAI